MVEVTGRSLNGISRGESSIELVVKLGLLALLVYWSFLLVRPFVPIVLWSAVLAVALYPAFGWVASLLGGRRVLAAVIITLLSLFIAVGPAAWLGLSVVEGARILADRLSSGALSVPTPPDAIKAWPLVGEPIHRFWTLASDNLASALAQAVPLLKPLGSSMLGMAAGAGGGIVKFLLSVVLAGFLLPPAPALVRGIKSFSSRIVSSGGAELVELAGATIRTVSREVIGISVLQALLAGIGLAIVGVPGAGLLAFAVMVAGIIQIGASIVLVPLIIWSWLTMEPMAAALFTAYMLPVNLIDNILKPIVMAKGLSTPMPVILVGVIGGTLAHGVIGLFLGPVVLAVAWELLVAWMNDDRDASSAQAGG